jgi:hypothetical protein
MKHGENDPPSFLLRMNDSGHQLWIFLQMLGVKHHGWVSADHSSSMVPDILNGQKGRKLPL